MEYRETTLIDTARYLPLSKPRSKPAIPPHLKSSVLEHKSHRKISKVKNPVRFDYSNGPPEVLLLLFEKMSLDVLVKASATSRYWKELANVALGLRPLCYLMGKDYSPARVMAICHNLKRFAHLKKVTIPRSDRVRSWTFLASFTWLEELSVDHLSSTEELLNEIGSLTHLKTLVLTCARLPNAFTGLLAIKAPGIRSLSILSPLVWHNPSLDELCRLKGLRTLVLEDRRLNWPARALRPIGRLYQLQKLTIRVSWLQQYEWLPKLTNLTELGFSTIECYRDNPHLFDMLGDRAYVETSYVSNLTNLRKLHICGDVSNFAHLQNLTQLTELSLVHTTLPELRSISGATNLRSLDLRGCEFVPLIDPSAELAALISGCPHLEQLSVASIAFDKAHKMNFIDILPPTITKLNLSDTIVGNSELIANLPRLNGLRELQIAWCPNVSQAVREALIQLPELRMLSIDARRWWNRYIAMVMRACPKLRQLRQPLVPYLYKLLDLGVF